MRELTMAAEDGREPLENQPIRQERLPSYQVAADLRARIAQGEFLPGERLPPQRTLAGQYGVSINTLVRALGVLRHVGVLVADTHRGTRVNNSIEHLPELPR